MKAGVKYEFQRAGIPTTRTRVRTVLARAGHIRGGRWRQIPHPVAPRHAGFAAAPAPQDAAARRVQGKRPGESVAGKKSSSARTNRWTATSLRSSTTKSGAAPSAGKARATGPETERGQFKRPVSRIEAPDSVAGIRVDSVRAERRNPLWRPCILRFQRKARNKFLLKPSQI